MRGTRQCRRRRGRCRWACGFRRTTAASCTATSPIWRWCRCGGGNAEIPSAYFKWASSRTPSVGATCPQKSRKGSLAVCPVLLHPTRMTLAAVSALPSAVQGTMVCTACLHPPPGCAPFRTVRLWCNAAALSAAGAGRACRRDLGGGIQPRGAPPGNRRPGHRRAHVGGAAGSRLLFRGARSCF